MRTIPNFALLSHHSAFAKNEYNRVDVETGLKRGVKTTMIIDLRNPYLIAMPIQFTDEEQQCEIVSRYTGRIFESDYIYGKKTLWLLFLGLADRPLGTCSTSLSDTALDMFEFLDEYPGRLQHPYGFIPEFEEWPTVFNLRNKREWEGVTYLLHRETMTIVKQTTFGDPEKLDSFVSMYIKRNNNASYATVIGNKTFNVLTNPKPLNVEEKVLPDLNNRILAECASYIEEGYAKGFIK